MWNTCGAFANMGGIPGGHALWGLLLLTGIGVLLWRLTRPRNSSGQADKTDSLEYLKMRLAKGEISVEEFTRLKEYL